MAQTQKMYLGDHEIGITRFGEDGNIINGSFRYEVDVDFLIVGGGGSGGRFGNQNAGGGGAGRFVSGSLTLGVGTYSAVVGNGGATAGTDDPGNNGQQSTWTIEATTYTAPGGGGGGAGLNSGTDKNGKDGGSGGGGSGTGIGGSSSGGSNVAGSPISGFGNDGESNGSSDSVGGHGGGADGYNERAWVDGQNYAGGGSGGGSGRTNPTSIGSGGRGSASGVDLGTAGQDGVVKIRYAGSVQKATGGTVTQNGGYTYHTFTSNGDFVISG